MSATTRTTVYTGYPWNDNGARLMVENILAECGVLNYTIYSAAGHWKGGSEIALIIEVLGDSGEAEFAITQAANVLKNNIDRPQEAIYIVTELVDLVVI